MCRNGAMTNITFIAVMGVLVGGVVLAVFLPILDIVGELGAS